MTPKGAIRLIGFADGLYAGRSAAFEQQAIETGFFDEIKIHNRRSLDLEFFNLHQGFMTSNTQGFGYWVWKPQVILQEIRDANPDDIIIYMDVGFDFNASQRERFFEYIEIAKASEWKMLSFFNIHTEYKWTKSDLAHRLGVHDNLEVMGTSQFSSGFFIFCPSRENVELIREWGELAIEDNYHFSDDTSSRNKSHPLFRQHRHDQSIFSLLRKKRGTAGTFYEVQDYQGHFVKLRKDVPAWAARLKE